MSEPANISLQDYEAWLKRFMAPTQQDKEPLIEVDHGDGTYHTENAKGQVRAIYGAQFREAIHKLQ